ncbi:MAG: hypothetical protein K6T54_07025 [Ignavibacterium sp.]|nr:hypothetical protein [Ignavibacterium sp.]
MCAKKSEENAIEEELPDVESEIPKGYYRVWKKKGKGWFALKSIQFAGLRKEDLEEQLGETYGDGSYIVKNQATGVNFEIDVVGFGEKEYKLQQEPTTQQPIQQPASISGINEVINDLRASIIATTLANLKIKLEKGEITPSQALKEIEPAITQEDPEEKVLNKLLKYKELFEDGKEDLRTRLEEYALMKEVFGSEQQQIGKSWADLVDNLINKAPEVLKNIEGIQEKKLQLIKLEKLKKMREKQKQMLQQTQMPQKDALDILVDSFKPYYNEQTIQQLTSLIEAEADLFIMIKPQLVTWNEIQISNLAEMLDNNLLTAENLIRKLRERGMPKFAEIVETPKGKQAIEKLIKSIDVYFFGIENGSSTTTERNKQNKAKGNGMATSEEESENIETDV